MSSMKTFFACVVIAGAVTLIASGCSRRSEKTPTSPLNAAAPTATATIESEIKKVERTSDSATGDHGHKPGAHGGIMISLGRDSFHAEAVFERGGRLRLYMLGNDESRVIDIDHQTLKGFVRIDSDADAQPFELIPEPQDGDAEGRTSQFVAVLPDGLVGKNLEVTIPNIVISGERFRMGFKSITDQQSHVSDSMPAKATSSEEQQLYLTSGGLYTEQDIVANGRTTAAKKFKGLITNHNAKPAVGDKICPISMTKANPQFTWIISGKAYEFCCPPCVDEFVRTAKSQPNEVREPADYVQR